MGCATFGHGWELIDEQEVRGRSIRKTSPERVVLPDSGRDAAWSVHWADGLHGLLRGPAGHQQQHVSGPASPQPRLPWLPGATPQAWQVVRDGCYMAPYITNGPWWIGYDDVESIKLKAQLVNSRGLGGVMVW